MVPDKQICFNCKKKSNFIVLTCKNKKYCFKKRPRNLIGGNEMEQVTSTRFLWVLIDEKLSLKDHITFVCSKVMKSGDIITKISGLVHQACFLTLYYSLIYPYLIYCNILWASGYNALQKYSPPLAFFLFCCITTCNFDFYLDLRGNI